MTRLILFNKPYLVLCQFSDPSDGLEASAAGRSTLADYIPIKNVYAAGRLDYDSEGLVILTDSGKLQHSITDPQNKFPKTYRVQVEGLPTDEALSKLARGVTLNDGPARPAQVKRIPEPEIWPRNPPIRYRKNIPTSWLEITITEGRKRQVRRMTAAVGHPTLRLIRIAIGEWTLADLKPGEWKEIGMTEGRFTRSLP